MDTEVKSAFYQAMEERLDSLLSLQARYIHVKTKKDLKIFEDRIKKEKEYFLNLLQDNAVDILDYQRTIQELNQEIAILKGY